VLVEKRHRVYTDMWVRRKTAEDPLRKMGRRNAVWHAQATWPHSALMPKGLEGGGVCLALVGNEGPVKNIADFSGDFSARQGKGRGTAGWRDKGGWVTLGE